MPGLVRTLVIFAAVDGLVLQQRASRPNPPSSIEIQYKTGRIARSLQLHHLDEIDSSKKLEAHGLIGLLKLSSYSFLLAIAGRKLVAHIFGKPVYLITDVAIIPLASQHEAEHAIKSSAEALKSQTPDDSFDQRAVSNLVDDAENGPLTPLEDTWLDGHSPHRSHNRSGSAVERSADEAGSSSAVAQDVIGRKGAYGRFTERWFSKGGWTTGQRRNMGMSSHDDLPGIKSPSHSRQTSAIPPPPPPAGTSQQRDEFGDFLSRSTRQSVSGTAGKEEKPTAHDQIVETLLPKLLQTLKLLLESNTFYFSYDYDITRRCGTQHRDSSDVVLHKQSDPHYLWNANLTRPLVDEGLDEYVLPIMQGFIGQRAFTVDRDGRNGSNESDSDDQAQVVDASSGDPKSVADTAEGPRKSHQSSFVLTLISRRSIKRAGFRYMRRGIDSEGNVANFVETEQILSSPDWNHQMVHSFTQIRGSIPLFYSQTPYTFKPPPTFHGSKEANQTALKTHFTALTNAYGAIQAVSLIDHHGPEASIGTAYQTHVDHLNATSLFNNRPLPLERFDFHHICRGMAFENVAILVRTLAPFLAHIHWTTHATLQRGTIRTNCMDCLDRTNVVQSAIAQHVLTQQLAASLPTSPSTDPADATSEAVSHLWADNGDVLSLAYAGTAALKGDYVRTRRRHLRGLLTDFALTLARYHRNLFDDFFAQAALDYALGAVDASVFVEFAAGLTTADPAIDVRAARERAVAGAARVVHVEEDFLAGWAFGVSGTGWDGDGSVAALRARPFEEALVLLTDGALYLVRYEWEAERVGAWERVPLGSVTRLQRGAYVVQTLTLAQCDEGRNAGVLVEFDRAGVVRQGMDETGDERKGMWALKALPSRGREQDSVRDVCEEIRRAAERDANGPSVSGGRTSGGATRATTLDVHEGPIVSLAQAQQATGMVEHIEHNLKRLVWG